ncbi:zinc finger protein 431-like isoform X2 [Phlebotomus argentipes]|uniref:zinc finger protein 431-like isoform X2 n=1 Tax=Phlebotomus argentipes TaxID=94469 RepID=UPI0028929B8D|nr:zinc finger protein 431-like isoform X2 [Phlebotomus argentipes]
MDSEEDTKPKVECVDLDEEPADVQVLEEEQKVKKEEPDAEPCFEFLDPEMDVDGDEWKKEDESTSSDSSEGVKRRKRRERRNTRKTTRKIPAPKKPLLPALFCYLCGKKYSKNHRLTLHLNEHYENRGMFSATEYPCTVDNCGKVFTAMKFLECHMRYHEIDKTYDCKICNRGFTTFRIFKIHRRSHNDEKNFHCEICPRSFVYENALIIHVEEHIKELPFPQELINIHVTPTIEEKEKARLGVDQELLTGGILFKCSQCPRKFASNNERRNHQTKDHPKMMTCELCGKVLRGTFAHRLHMLTHTREKPFKCKQCGEFFASPTLLMVHRRVAHGSGTPDRNYRPHQCEYCGKSYVFKYSLTEHVNFKHKDVKVICDLCGHSYVTKSRLKRHFKKVHLNESLSGDKVKTRRGKPLKVPKCPECDFVAPRHRDLRLHRIKLHMNNLHCDDCNVTLENIMVYKRHVDDHKDGISVVSGPGRHGQIYGCLRCDKFYTDRRFLREHINMTHNSITFTCDHCEMIFQTKRAMVRHLSSTHGVEEKQPQPRKVQGLKAKKPKKMKIKFPPPSETSSQSSHHYQMEPPQSSPLALQIPHQSPVTIVAANPHAHVTPPPHEIQQQFKVEPQLQYIHFGNM